jgi:hypothetical protein
LRREDGLRRQDERTGGLAFEGTEFAVCRELDAVDNAKLAIEVNEVKRGEGAGDRDASEMREPKPGLGVRSEPFDQDLQDSEGFTPGVKGLELSAEEAFPGLVICIIFSCIHTPSSL